MTADCGIDEKAFQLMHPDVIEEVINRSSVELPDTFVPSAKRIALGDGGLLWLVTPPRTYPPVGHWVGRAREGRFMRFADNDNYLLSVRRYGKLWSVERKKLGADTGEVLAFAFGSTPILLRRYEDARAIARQSHPSPSEKAQYVCWIPSPHETKP
jgi:hypothetical protein